MQLTEQNSKRFDELSTEWAKLYTAQRWELKGKQKEEALGRMEEINTEQEEILKQTNESQKN